MDHKMFGKLVAALRRERFNADGERFTQAMLAVRARELDPTTPVNELIIGKIERGERALLDKSTLLSLTHALGLTMGERQIFFQLASGLDNASLYAMAQDDDHTLLRSAIQMVADIQLPALLLDQYLDVIAVNALLLPFYQTSYADLQRRTGQPAAYNLLALIFSDDFAHVRQQMPRQQWHEFAVGNVIYFRRTTFPYRMTPYFHHLFAQLRRNRDFRWFWEQVSYEETRSFVGGELLEMRAPSTGSFRFLTAPLIQLTPYGNLEIITHIPRDRATAQFIYQLLQDCPTTAYQLSPWPDKGIEST